MTVILTEEEKNLIEKIGIRISNKKIRVIIRKIEESYTNESVIVVPPTIDAFTTISIVVHQGAHHRFRSLINDTIYKQISNEYPEISHIILDAFEDYRCNLLNKRIFPGFVREFQNYISKTKAYHNNSNILLNTVMQVHQRLEFESIFDPNNTYPIWDLVDEQKAFVKNYLSTSTILIATKKIVDNIIDFYKKDSNGLYEPLKNKEFIQKTQTPHFYSYFLQNKNSLDHPESFLSHMIKSNFDMKGIEEKLRDERTLVVKTISDMKKLSKLDKPQYQKSNIKVECLSPEQYGCGDNYLDIIYRNASLIAKLRREFQQIMRSPNPARGGRRGKVMARDLPRFVTSNGMFDKVFKIDQNNYGSNLMILVDESGSMTRENLPIAREAIITIMEALEGTKINTCVIGFAAKNNSLVVSEKVYKKFNYPINRETLGSINTTEGYEYNRDGDSFELAAKHFSETNHLKSIMIILSDGCPNHGERYTSIEGRRLTNLSIRSLRNKGISIHALGIKIYGRLSYSEMYDNKGISFINSYEIENALLNLIRQISLSLEIY